MQADEAVDLGHPGGIACGREQGFLADLAAAKPDKLVGPLPRIRPVGGLSRNRLASFVWPFLWQGEMADHRGVKCQFMVPAV